MAAKKKIEQKKTCLKMEKTLKVDTTTKTASDKTEKMGVVAARALCYHITKCCDIAIKVTNC